MSSYLERKVRNDQAKARADHDRQLWTSVEIELLLLWDGTEEELAVLAELFGRTIEACRQHYYLSRRDPRPSARGHASQPQSSGGSPRTSSPARTLSMAAWTEEDRAEWAWLEGGSR